MVESDCIEIKTRVLSGGQLHECRKRIVPEENRFARFARSSPGINVVIIPDGAYDVLETIVQGEGPGNLVDMLEASPVLKGCKTTGVYIEA